MNRRTTTKKREQLIDLVCEIPSLDTIKSDMISLNMQIDREHNAMDYLISALEIVSKNTKDEDLIHEIISKCIILFGNENLADGRKYFIKED